MVRKSNTDKPYRLPPINGKLGERLQRALYVYNGKKGAIITKTIEDMIENELTYGFLADSDKKASYYGDDFWKEFDTSTSFIHVATTQMTLRTLEDETVYRVIDNMPIYTYGKITTKVLNRFIEDAFEQLMDEGTLKKIEITSNLLKTWRGKLSETRRFTNVNGTSFWNVNRWNFTEITEENKQIYEGRINATGLLGFEIKVDKSAQILSKIKIGEMMHFKDFCKRTGLKGDAAKDMLDKLKNSGDMQQDKNSGMWVRIDPAAAMTLKENCIMYNYL